jgi:hypothetical protein
MTRNESDLVAQLLAELAATKDKLVATEGELAASKGELVATEGELAASKGETKTERDLKMGIFYATLNQVFAWLSMEYTRAHFDALHRTGYPARGYKYRETLYAARLANHKPDDKDQSSQTFEKAKQIWPWDIFGNLNDYAQIAHLIPASSDNASMYDDVVAWALGLTEHNVLGRSSTLSDADTSQLAAAKQKAIHGSRDPAGNKVASTGLKHSQSNKMRIRGQREYLDESPCLIIVPVMSLEEMKNWEGDGYSAIVMAETWVNKHGKTTTIENVCSGIQMQTEVPGASVAEIQLAQELLQAVVCGMAYSLKVNDHPSLPKDSATELAKLRRAYVFSNVIGGVTVPTLTKGARGEEGDDFPPVRKVTFGRVGDNEMHPAPDPLLLTVKAAVVWSTRYKQQLLAGGEVKDDTDSLSSQAEDEYLASMAELGKAKDDLFSNMGQPQGYQDANI